jgi:hypothetical protein
MNRFSWLKATSLGDNPTGTGVPTIMFVAGPITQTVLLLMLVTYLNLGIELKAMSHGTDSTGTEQGTGDTYGTIRG